MGQGSFTLTLAPGALAMAAQGTDGGGDSPSKYRPPSIESWRKPRFTEDGKILPYKGTRNPPTPITNLGRNRAGQTVTNGKTTVRFDKDGFPEFDTKFEMLLDDIHIGSKRPELHFKAANRALNDAFSVLLIVSADREKEAYSVSKAYQVLEPHVPAGIFPFALTPGGKYLCFDYRESSEQPKITLVTVEMHIYPVAESFTDFMASLHDGQDVLA